MTVSQYTTQNITLAGWVWLNKEETEAAATKKAFAPLQPVRQWLDQIEVSDRALAHRLCKLIPAQCPFERDVKLFGRTLFHIPPMCKLNPLYEQVVSLRFRALCYLADKCGEDVTAYC
ncbi:MAG: Mo-dependent nitrogenase C-terminal domain-containing protein [Aphanothece sp. CMT-3BRIN-NPC111]|jgi:hypothetical protein|nr:Mo-dependent nitrogenase C-terminal domain-containing protein [Aphanothece sp. CMT-3BRIN-NPC111]